MEIIIGLALIVIAALVMMILMTMFYHVLYAVMPLLVFVALAIGIVFGLWKTIRNTIESAKEVYGGK